MADRGRLPVARETEDGAEAEDGRAGNTNGGFGGGTLDLGDASGLAREVDCEDIVCSAFASWFGAVPS